LRSAAYEKRPDVREELLRRAIAETDQLLNSFHQIASRVRPSILDDLGLRDGIESFLSDYRRRTNIDVNARLDFSSDRVPATVGDNVYRILQEGLANIAKHARTKRAWITIELDDRYLRMTIVDSGVGFQANGQNTSRLGILGMQERAELLGGELEIVSKPGDGTRVDVRIPLEGPSTERT
jgi:signal transduction histidine kinase